MLLNKSRFDNSTRSCNYLCYWLICPIIIPYWFFLFRPLDAVNTYAVDFPANGGTSNV
jgi:hypothetical protein